MSAGQKYQQRQVFSADIQNSEPLADIWDFRSLGHGNIDFEDIIRALNPINYKGPLSVEWEDSGMDREFGAKEACEFVRKVDFPSSNIAFDAAFEKK